MKTLSDSLHARISLLSRQGDHLLDTGDCVGALENYHEAWKLIPERKEDWEAATWLLSAIGEAHFNAGDFKHSVAAFENALQCPSGLGNPYIHLRLGESYFELGDLARSQDELTRAYLGGGNELFENEPMKYFSFLKSVLQPPPGADSI